MEKFISRLSITLIILSIVVIAPVIYKKAFYKKLDFSIDKTKNILVLGDSHTECAVDDAALQHSANYSQSGESYLYSYIKLKRFIADNPQINTVLLTFSYYSLSDKFNYWYDRDDFVAEKMHKYFLFMNFSEIKEIAQLNPITLYKTIFGEKFRDIIFDPSLDIKDLRLGAYLNLNRNKLKEAIEERSRQPISEMHISKLQAKYLGKIVDFCNTHKLRLVFLNSPMYDGGSFHYMKDWLYEYYNNNYKHIPYLDYADFKMPDSCYGDVDHLNHSGAAYFSGFLNKQLN